jgi:hypothetical protein
VPTVQLRIYAAIIVYMASYFPLSIILFIQDLDYHTASHGICEDWLSFGERCAIPLHHPVLAVIVVLVSLACLLVALLTIQLIKPGRSIAIVESKHVPTDLMSYVLPYVVSFMSLDFGDSSKFLGFAVFFAWIFLITYRSGQIIMNPMLAVFGYRLYELKYAYQGGSAVIYSGFALSNTQLEPNTVHKHSSIQDVIIIKASKG